MKTSNATSPFRVCALPWQSASVLFKVWFKPALLGVLLLLANTQTTRAADFGDISIRLEPLAPGGNERGYQEFRATIVNHSPARAHRVTLVFPDQLYSARGNIIREMRRSVEIAPNATVQVSLFQPPLPLNGSNVRVLIDERMQEAAIPLSFSGGARPVAYGGDAHQRVLVSSSIAKSKALDYAETILRNNAGQVAFATTRSELPLNEWSTYWLGYSGYDGVVLSANEWRGAADNVRQALWRYLECGGTLLIFGGAEVPALWQASRVVVSHTEEAAAQGTATAEATAAAAGVAVPVPPEPEATPAPTPTPAPTVTVREDLQTYSVGFGSLMIMPAQAQPAMTAAQWQAAKAAWERGPAYPARPYEVTNATFEELNTQLPIIEKLTIPVRGLFLLMLLFVVVIGPLNLIVLARKQKKIWLLWTVPAISLLTCLAIALYAIGSEGLSGHTRTYSLTLLDEGAHRATTFGVTGFYSPLTPSDGLHFSYDTEVVPVLPYYSYYNDRGGTARTVDWTNEQHLTSGWVAARVPTWFQTRRSETRRERLSINLNAAGVPVVTNGLGVPIRQLWLPNDKRTLYEANDIAPGAQVELKASARPGAVETLPQLRNVLRSGWLRSMDYLAEKPELNLAPGTYLAVLEAAPFTEPGLRNVRQTTMKTLVLGIRAK